MIGEIYEARRLDDFSWQNINSEFQADRLWNSSNIKVITSTYFDSAFVHHAAVMARTGMIYKPSFMTIASDIQVILSLLPHQ
jgi:hypothetical protein